MFRSSLSRRVVRGFSATAWQPSASASFVLMQQQQRRYKGTDAITTLVRDHHAAYHLIDQLHPVKGDEASGAETLGPQERRNTLNALIRLLSIHSAIEELHMYPLIRKVLKDGNKYIDRSIHEHLALKEVLYELDQFSSSLAGDPKTWPEFPVSKLEAVRGLLGTHATEEEEEIFPKLKESVNENTLMELGETLDAARETAPTRPHPNAPSEPPLGPVAAAMAAAYDRARDALREATQTTGEGTPGVAGV